jgi:O-antigen/teichoic acid export membrane protein
MMKRTKIGLLSAIIVAFEALLTGALTMVRTKVILEAFGTNINGVISVATSLSAYMLLFESGMTAAYQYNMYKPLLAGDYARISSLYAGMKKNFLSVTVKMTACSLAIAFIYSIILQDKGVTYSEAVSLLSIMGLRIVAPYLFTISLRTLLIVRERKFVTDIVETLKNTLTIVIEILLIKHSALPLYIILCTQIVLTFLTRYIYLCLVKVYFKNDIDHSALPDMTPRSMTGDILVHRVAGLITNNTDTVLLSFFKELGLNSVTIYNSYSSVILYPITLVNRLIESMRATLALKITGDERNAYTYFREVFSFGKLCALVIIPAFISQINDFVILWIGKEYTIGLLDVVLFALFGMHKILIPTVYAMRDAKGLYKESKSYSIAQAIVNMLLSLVLIKPLGITGVLIGTVICDWLVLEPFNIRLVFSKVFGKKFDMVIDYAFMFIVIAAMAWVSTILNSIVFPGSLSWSYFIVRSVVVITFTTIISFSYLLATDFGFRSLLIRFLPRKHISKKKEKS